MAIKKRGLGRGLDALLGGAVERNNEQGGHDASATGQGSLPVDLIQRGRFQPRRDFAEQGLQELADSINAQGLVQPIVVRPIDGDRYEIIAGERRWRAAQMAGLADIPVVIHKVDDQTAMAMGLIENIQRQDLNAVEEASALNRLLNEFGLTHQQVAEAVGKSRSAVSNLMRLLELNDDVKTMIESHQLEMGHARALLALKGHVQSSAAQQIAKKALSVRQTEALVRNLLQAVDASAEDKKKVQVKADPDVDRLLQSISERLGALVNLQPGRGGKGKLIISYNSLDELDGILDHIH